MKPRGFAVVLLALALLVNSACSLGIFGDGKDQGIENIPAYRRVNLACANMDLSSPTLDVVTFKKVIGCFNSNGALEPVARLVEILDQEKRLEPIVQTGNKYILNNRKTLYQTERTYFALDDRKIIDEVFLQFGRLLENEKFIAAVIALMKEGYFAGGGGRVPDQNILKAVEHISKQITPALAEDILDGALALSTAHSFGELQSRFKEKTLDDDMLRTLMTHLRAYLQNKDPEHLLVSHTVIDSIISGDLFHGLDDFFGPDKKDFLVSIPRMSAILTSLLENGGSTMGSLSGLFNIASQPLKCVGGGAEVRSPILFTISEILSKQSTVEVASYIKRDSLLTLSIMNPFCGDQLLEIGKHYGALVDLADTTVIEPTTDLLRAFYNTGPERNHPLIDLTTKVLGDPALVDLIPILSEISSREHAWDDLLLVASLLRPEDRHKVVNALKWAVAKVPYIDQKSVFDVLGDVVSRASISSLFALARSLGMFTESSDKILERAMKSLRDAYYVNDVHPLINLVHDIMEDATKNEAFFSALFAMSEKPEFRESVKLISNMAKDGRLKELIGGITTLFHKFALEGQTPIRPVDQPAFNPMDKLRHNWSASDLTAFVPLPLELASDQACRNVKIDFPITNPWAMDHVLACYNYDGKHGNVVEAVSFLEREKTEGGESYFNFAIRVLKAAEFAVSEAKFLVQKWLGALDDGRVDRLMSALPYWIKKSIVGSDGSAGTLLKPLVDLAKPLMERARIELQRLEVFAAGVISGKDAPKLLEYVDKLLNYKPKDEVSTSRNQSFDRERIGRWVRNEECERISVADVNTRVQTIVDDYEQSVNAWEMFCDGERKTCPESRWLEGKQRRDWTLDEMKGRLGNILKKFSDPHQSVKDFTLPDAMTAFLRYFSLHSNERPSQYKHHSPEDLLRWLKDRSNDYRLITYFYPGEKSPRVRLANTLDLLELGLISADYTAPWPYSRNYSMQFLAEIGEAWGDEPFEFWPVEIQNKFPKGSGKQPRTLREVYRRIMHVQTTFENIVGFPHLPKCPQYGSEPINDPTTDTWGLPDWFPGMDVKAMKANLFNGRRSLFVIEENLPNTPGDPNPHPNAGGMRVLRDLFFHVLYSTPPAYRNSKAGEKNNLSFILRSVRMGVLHQTGRYIRALEDKDYPRLVDFFNAFVFGGTSQGMDDVWKVVLSQKENHELVWSLIGDIFGIINAAEDRDLDPAHKKELEGKTPEQVAAIKKGWIEELGRLRQLGFDSFAVSHQLGISNEMLVGLADVLKNHLIYFSESSGGKFGPLLRSKVASELVHALYMDDDSEGKEKLTKVLSDVFDVPQSHPSLVSDAMSVLIAIQPESGPDLFDVFKKRRDALQLDPRYQGLNIDEISGQIFDFFTEKNGGSDSIATAYALRVYLADRLKNGDLDQFLLLAAKNPAEFYRVLETMSDSKSELMDLFHYIRRGLSQ